MGTFLSYADLTALAPSLTKAEADIYIEDVEAQALGEVPCLVSPDFPAEMIPAVKSILRQAVLRWNRAGDGALSAQSQTAGAFGFSQTFDTRVRGEGRLFDGEIRRLRSFCGAASAASSSSRRRAATVLPR